MKIIRMIMLLFVGAAISITYSCEKDATDNPDSGGSDKPAEKKCYIKTTNLPNAEKKVYEYNSDNNLIKLTKYYSNGNVDYVASFDYLNGKVIEYSSSKQNGTASVRMEYSYNANKELEKAKIFYNSGSGMKEVAYYEYTYVEGLLAQLSHYKLDQGSSYELIRSEYFYNGDLVSKCKKYRYNGSSQVMDLESVEDYEYDGKKNPSHDIGVNDILGGYANMNKENLVKLTISTPQGIVDKNTSINITYEYNDNDYPIKQTNLNFYNKDEEKFTYEYDCK